MTIQDFITKAIEGGWKTEHPYEPNTQGFRDELNRALLDSLAWQAVGKVEGWKSPHNIAIQTEWSKKMHGLVDALILGKTIEQYLETL